VELLEDPGDLLEVAHRIARRRVDPVAAQQCNEPVLVAAEIQHGGARQEQILAQLLRARDKLSTSDRRSE